eukprot:Clim_evm11s154 gene=Clim_evmTU11s154
MASLRRAGTLSDGAVHKCKAQVFTANQGSWQPKTSVAITISVLHHASKETRRILGMHNKEVIVNSAIEEGQKLEKLNEVFASWTDRLGEIIGLQFLDAETCDIFGRVFAESVEMAARRNGSYSSLPRSSQATLAEEPESEAAGDIEDLKRRVAELLREKDDMAKVLAHEREKVARLENNAGHSAAAGGSLSSVPSGGDVSQDLVNQNAALREENNKLKVAMARSQANVTTWQKEIRTLKNNNARLVAALREATSNSETWRNTLMAMIDQNTKLSQKFQDLQDVQTRFHTILKA